jgi:CheY-like chemotaxis protein
MEDQAIAKAILCVDDEAIVLLYLVSTLRNNYGDRFLYEKAANAENGMQVLSALHAQGVRIVLILSDWLMPGMNGDEFLQSVHAKYPSIKAIMISGRVDESQVDHLRADKFDFVFLSKPLVPKALFRAIDSLGL